jgi:YesN/AraC family two-component response regulator
MDQLKKLIDLNKSVPFIRMMQRYIDECMEDQHCDVSDVRACFQELIFHIRKHILEFNIPLDLSLQPERLSALLYEMDSMHDIRDEILPKFEQLCEIIGQYRRNEHAGDIQKAIAYIDNHYYTDITMNESAQYAFMSPPYFSAKFKETVGHNFTDYVKLKRLIRAAELLVDTDYRIREIASHVGYQDEKYFSRVFKSHYHMSPVRYREIHKEVME